MHLISSLLIGAAALMGFTETVDSVIDLASPDTPYLEYHEPSALRYNDPEFLDLLGRGWRTPYSGHIVEHSDALWATSIHAEMEVFVLHPRDLLLHLALRPHFIEDYEAQSVEVVFNDTHLGTCAFVKEEGWGFKQFSLAVPKSAIRRDMNTIKFLSRYCVSAKDVGRGGDQADGRAIAFGIAVLSLIEPGVMPDFDGPKPKATVADGALTLPPGCRVAVPFNLGGAESAKVFAESIAGPIRIEQESGIGGISWSPREPTNEGIEFSMHHAAFGSAVFDHPGGAEPASWNGVRIEYARPLGDTPNDKYYDGVPLGRDMRIAMQRPETKRVIVIVHDTLRADATGFAGAPRAVSPFMDELAKKGRMYTKSYTHSSWTYPSIVSIFSGLYPVQHGVKYQDSAISDEAQTLAELLKTQGIVSGCIAENPYFAPRYKLDRGFDTYEYVYPTQATGGPRGSDTVLVKAEEFLTNHREDRFFLYLQFFPPHAPYAAGNPFAETFSKDIHVAIPPDDVAMHEAEIGIAPLSDEGLQQLRARYDENVRYADDMTRQIFGMLEAKGYGAETAIIITSDHGESFGEHGHMGHSDTPHEPQVHVPFLYLQGTEGTGPRDEIDTFVHTVDLFPTITTLLGVETPANVSGISLFDSEPTYYQGIINMMQAEDLNPQIAYRTPRYKLILDPAGPLRELYDLQIDPEETSNIVKFRPLLADYIEAHGKAWQRAQVEKTQLESGTTATMSEEERKQLETLGYF